MPVKCGGEHDMKTDEQAKPTGVFSTRVGGGEDQLTNCQLLNLRKCIEFLTYQIGSYRINAVEYLSNKIESYRIIVK